MKSRKQTLLICLSVASLVVLSVGIAVWIKSNRASLQDVKLGCPTWRLRIANAFRYDKNGHLGALTQYLSRHADSENGSYCVQCNKGKVITITVKYSPPVSREQSLKIVQRLVGRDAVEDKSQRDSSEINTKADVLSAAVTGQPGSKYYCPPSEYVYFNQGRAAELQFVSPKDQRVTDIMVWG